MIVLLLTSLFCASGIAEEIDIKNLMINHPEWYIKITDWHVYAGWSCPAIIHHVTIENTSDIAYKGIKIRVLYYSTTYENYGTQISQETGVLPVIVAPHSKETYLKNGGHSRSRMYGYVCRVFRGLRGYSCIRWKIILKVMESIISPCLFVIPLVNLGY
jgi:hypothetical protein